MIISPAQLRAINEDVRYNVDTSMAGINAAYAAAKDKPEAKNGINFHITDSPVNTSNGEETTAIATSPEDLTNAAGSYNNIRMPAQQNESRFSKRQVELGRMLEMRRTGKVFSKKQLNEMFMETKENADELRSLFQNGGGRNLAFKVAEIIDDVFPEESYGSELLDAVLGGADPAEFIIQNIFSDFADKEQEREVLDRIRELTSKRGF